jgi:hypothetical protein
MQVIESVTYHIGRNGELTQGQTSISHHRVVREMRRHAIQQSTDNVIFQYRSKLDFFFALDNVKECGASGNLYVLDANMLVHCNQHGTQSSVNLRTVLESEQVIQIIKHFGEHFIAVLVHDGGKKNLIFIRIASNALRGYVVSSTC